MGKIIIETSKLKSMIESVKGAIAKDLSDDWSQIYLQTFVSEDSRKIKMIACDGYKVFVNQCDVIECTELDLYIPAIKIPKNADEHTIIEINDDQINFNFGNVVMSYKRNYGKFGNVGYVFERKSDYRIRVNPKFLKDAIKNMKAAVELGFQTYSGEEAIIIKNTENENEQKFILPIKIRKEDKDG